MFPKFCWAPASGDTHPLLVHAPHVFFEVLRITFGPFPLTLTMDDMGVLREMATRSLGERGYEDLLAALQDYDTISVAAQLYSEGTNWPRSL